MARKSRSVSVDTSSEKNEGKAKRLRAVVYARLSHEKEETIERDTSG